MNEEEILKQLPNYFYLSNDDKKTLMWKEITEEIQPNKFSRDKHNRDLANKPAGRVQQDGYIRVQFKGKKYQAHVIAFALVNNKFPMPDYQIDHVDRDRSDNSNLMEVSIEENLANRGGQFQVQRSKITNVSNIEMIKLEDIEEISPNNKVLRIDSSRYTSTDIELLENEIHSMEYEFFQPLQVVRCDDQIFLADGYARYQVYMTDKSRFEYVPVIINEIEEMEDLVETCRDISAEFNSRPSVKAQPEKIREALYQKMWSIAIIDRSNKSIRFNQPTGTLTEKYRCGKNLPTMMRKIIEYFVEFDIDPDNYKADLMIMKNELIARPISNSGIDLEMEEAKIEIMKFIKSATKVKGYNRLASNPEELSEIIRMVTNGNDVAHKQSFDLMYGTNTAPDEELIRLREDARDLERRLQMKTVYDVLGFDE